MEDFWVGQVLKVNGLLWVISNVYQNGRVEGICLNETSRVFIGKPDTSCIVADTVGDYITRRLRLPFSDLFGAI